MDYSHDGYLIISRKVRERIWETLNRSLSKS